MKLARARVTQGSNRPEPEFQGAARGNSQQLLQVLLHFRQRLRDVETASGGANINLGKPARNATAPPFAGLDVSSLKGSGRVLVKITNPQYQVSAKNTPGTPMYHHIEYSDNPQFTKSTPLPVTNQTYIELSRPAGTRTYFKMRSSLDGKTKNAPQFSGPVHS